MMMEVLHSSGMVFYQYSVMIARSNVGMVAGKVVYHDVLCAEVIKAEIIIHRGRDKLS